MKSKAIFVGIWCDFQVGQKQLVLSVMQNNLSHIIIYSTRTKKLMSFWYFSLVLVQILWFLSSSTPAFWSGEYCPLGGGTFYSL